MIKIENTVLFGSEDCPAAMRASVQAAQMWAKSGATEIDVPKIYNRMGDVGVVSVKGSLYTGSTGWMAAFGLVGYEDIQNALLEALSDKKAKRIVMDFNTGGGAVKGVQALAETIYSARGIKPMTAFADSALSAGYWLASATDHVMVEELGETGSIGAIIVHTEFSKAYEKEGITKTVIRAGENKALANTVEPLNDAAKEQLQAYANKGRDLFTNTIAMHRGVTASTVDSQFGRGRVFYGSEGVSAGLADSVGSFQDALARKG